jgi:molybdenum cofactor synthesis domain-containing protein
MDKNLTAGLLVIGNEILSGRTQDINVAFIGAKLADRGIKLAEVRIVPDVEDEIICAVNQMREKFGYLFTTGGIGPTHDDITSATVAKALGVSCELSGEARQILLGYYKTEEELTPARLKMAHIPSGASLIENPVSGAPGFQIENVYVMAGVPRIMQAMFEGLLSSIESGKPILSNTVTCNLPESKIAETLSNIQKKYEAINIGSYPHYRAGEMGLSLVLRGTDNDMLHLATRDVVDMVRSFGVDPIALSIKSSGKMIS